MGTKIVEWLFHHSQYYSLKYLFQCQIRIINSIPGSVFLFTPSTNGNLIETSATSSVFRKLKLVHFAHLVIYAIKGFAFFKQYMGSHVEIKTGSKLVSVIYWYILSFAGCFLFPFVRNRHLEFSASINTLFRNIAILQCSTVAKILLFISSFATLCLIFMFAIFEALFKYDPIKEEFLTNVPSIFLIPYKVIVNCYEIWNIAVLASIGSLVIINGMFLSYIALALKSNELFQQTKQLSGSKLESNLLKSLQQYKQLDLLATLSNNCFKKAIALPFQIMVFSTAIFLGVNIFHPGIRATTSNVGIAFCSYTLLYIYLVLIIGYSYPGRVHHISQNLRHVWKKIIWSNRLLMKHRRSVFACKDIRIHFGSVNFYERGTTLVLLNFITEKTISMVLLM